MAVIMAHLPQMNLVNLSTAIHRLAKLAATDPQSQAELRNSPAFEELLHAVSHALSSVDPTEAQPQSLSNVAWSLATVRSVNRPLLQVVAGLAVTNISSFKPFELSTILWAFAKLSTVDGSLVCLKPVFQAAAAHIMKQVAEFGFRCLATTAWAFATARQRHARLFRSIAAQMGPMVYAANCQEMANTAWAFGTADFHDEQLFTELAEKALSQLREFKPQELSNMLWGFATNGFFHEAFFSNASLAAQQMNLQSQHLANIVWAFVRVRPQHQVTHATILSMLPVCTRQLETFKPQEVSSTALAVAKAFSPGEEFERQHSMPQVDMMLPPQILDFFLAAMSWMMPRLHEFSAQSLANTVSAFTMMRIGGDQALYASVGQEVLRRFDMFEPTELLHLLKGFSCVPQDEVCAYVTRTLAAGVGRHIDTLRPQEMQTLSRICMSLLGVRRSPDLNVDDLRSCCLQFASSEVDTSLQPSLAGHGKGVHSHGSGWDTKPRLHDHDPRVQATLAMETERYLPPEVLSSLSPAPPPVAPHGMGMHPPMTKMQGHIPVPPDTQLALDNHIHHVNGNRGQFGKQRTPLRNQKVAARRGGASASARHQPALPSSAYPWIHEDPSPLATIREVGNPMLPPDMLVKVPDTPLAAGSVDPYDMGLDVAPTYMPGSASGALQPMPGVGMPGSFQWRCSVKNSFLHVECSDDNSEGSKDQEEAADDRSSQRSSSVPSRFDYDENWEDMNRRSQNQGNSPSWGNRYPDLNNLDFDWGGPDRRFQMPPMQGPRPWRTMPPRTLLHPEGTPPCPPAGQHLELPISGQNQSWRTMSAQALSPQGPKGKGTPMMAATAYM